MEAGYEIILSLIIEKTDAMLNSIRVNAFDTFENCLNDRQEFIDQLINLSPPKNSDLYDKIKVMEAQIIIELDRYKEELNIEFEKEKKEKNLLISNLKKTGQYKQHFEENVTNRSRFNEVK